MRITTDINIALADLDTRKAALSALRSTDGDLLGDIDDDTREQWVDDLIREWCIELQFELDSGVYP